MLINGYHRSDSVGMFVYGVRIDKLVLLQKKKKKKDYESKAPGFF